MSSRSCCAQARVLLVLGPFYLVSCVDVGCGEDARISCADRGCVPSADVGFERFRSAVNVVAAATCADLPPTVEDDPGFVVLSEPELWRRSLMPWLVRKSATSECKSDD